MARALTAYLNRENVPERKPLQQAIDALNFPLSLDDGYAPFATAGYLPCTLDGEDAGFNLRFQDVLEDATRELDLGDRNASLAFQWGGDPREEAAALIVCAALSQTFGACVQAAESKEFLPFERLVARAKRALEK